MVLFSMFLVKKNEINDNGTITSLSDNVFTAWLVDKCSSPA